MVHIKKKPREERTKGFKAMFKGQKVSGKNRILSTEKLGMFGW